MKTLITTLLTALSAPALAEVELTLSHSSGKMGDIQRGYESKASLTNDNLSMWASYATHEQIMVTQSPGDIDIIGAGIGYREQVSEGVSFYIEGGFATVSASYSDRIIRESIYFSFYPTFGDALWLPDQNYMDPALEYSADFEPAPIIRIGGQLNVTERLSIDASYRWMNAEQFLRIRYPGSSDETGWWEGTFGRDLSTFNVGATWRF